VVFCIGVCYRKHHHNGDVAGGAGHIGDFADLLEHLLFCFCSPGQELSFGPYLLKMAAFLAMWQAI